MVTISNPRVFRSPRAQRAFGWLRKWVLVSAAFVVTLAVCSMGLVFFGVQAQFWPVVTTFVTAFGAAIFVWYWLSRRWTTGMVVMDDHVRTGRWPLRHRVAFEVVELLTLERPHNAIAATALFRIVWGTGSCGVWLRSEDADEVFGMLRQRCGHAPAIVDGEHELVPWSPGFHSTACQALAREYRRRANWHVSAGCLLGAAAIAYSALIHFAGPAPLMAHATGWALWFGATAVAGRAIYFTIKAKDLEAETE
jgi:hypothetical protein